MHFLSTIDTVNTKIPLLSLNYPHIPNKSNIILIVDYKLIPTYII